MAIERIHGRKKHYIKIHFTVDVKTKEVTVVDVKIDEMHDSKVLPSLIMDTSRHRLISEACMMDHMIQGKHMDFLKE